MKNTFKVALVTALSFFSAATFAASQQAEELKKFTTWEEQNSEAIDAAFDEASTPFASMPSEDKLNELVSTYNSKVADILKSLDALEIKSPEVSELISKYKESVNAQGESLVAAADVIKKPSPEANEKLTAATSKLQETDNVWNALQDKLEEQFPAEE